MTLRRIADLCFANFTARNIMVSERDVKENIAGAVRNADLSTVSVRQIRRTVESQLGLEEGELSSEKWKSIVKTVIHETMEAMQNATSVPAKEIDPEEESHERIARIPI
jgi:DEK C terminal domain